MTFSQLYQQLLPLWGAELSFADGVLLEHKNPFLALGKLKGQENATAAREHFYSQEFSSRWQEAGQQIAPTELLAKQLLWAMYQVFHAKALALFQEGTYQLRPAHVPQAEIRAQLAKNLEQPGYEEELALLQALPA